MRCTYVISGIAALMLATISAVSAADLPAGHPPLDQARQATPATHSGEVLETLPASSYLYIRVKGAEGEEWLAAMSVDVKVGNKIKWNDGSIQRNFSSPSLNRKFESVRFVEVIEKAD